MASKKAKIELKLTDRIVFSTKCLATFEISAAVLTHLAYPTADDSKRAGIHASLCARELRQRYEVDPQLEWEPQIVKPGYLLREIDKIDRDMKALWRELKLRMIAARMAIPFFRRALDLPLGLPRSVKRLSLNQMSELALSDLGGHGDSHNVEARIWRPSLPVIHLAVAIIVLMNDQERTGLGAFTADNLMQDLELTKEVLLRAELYEMLAIASPLLRIPAEKVLRLRIE